jgi:sugar transferase (PEP-CTERM/EpsH1 system associated)
MIRPATLAQSGGWAEGEPRLEPVRVMHVMHQLGFGGMELGVVKLVNALDRARVMSSICSCTPATAARERLAHDVALIELKRREGNDPALVGRLYRVFRRERPDIVHTHAWGTLVEGLVAARLARVPMVVHGEHGTLQTKRHQLWVQRLAWGRADLVLSVSSRLAERMAREVGFPPARIRTIPNGVDLARFRGRDRDAARRALGISQSALVVGTVGRLVPVKDQRTLVSAAAALHAGLADLQVLLVGDGPLRNDLTRQIQALGLGAVVRLLGTRPDVEQVLPALDVFVLPSLSEGMSNTIQEAMGCGLPVVATDVGGARELVIPEDTGLLVPAGDPDALASALISLAQAPAQRGAMGAAARRRAEAVFSLERMIGDYERVYLELRQRNRAHEGSSDERHARAYSLQ